MKHFNRIGINSIKIDITKMKFRFSYTITVGKKIKVITCLGGKVRRFAKNIDM